MVVSWSGLVVTSRSERNGEKKIHRNARLCPMAATSRLARIPIVEPSVPPMRPPSGMVPQTRNRMLAFIRPRRCSGHRRWRKLTWVTL